MWRVPNTASSCSRNVCGDAISQFIILKFLWRVLLTRLLVLLTSFICYYCLISCRNWIYFSILLHYCYYYYCGNEPSGCVKCGEFDSLKTSWLLKKDFAAWIIIIIIIIIIIVYVQRFSWFSNSTGHWSSTSYLLFHTTLSNYTARVKCTASACEDWAVLICLVVFFYNTRCG